MGALSTLLNTSGLILLTHGVYSAYEHSLTTTTSSAPALPLDVTLETLFSLLLLCTGIVLGSPALRPIEWRVWAAQTEKDERLSLEERKRKGDKGELVGNPFRSLEDRSSFWDVRGMRREFASWIRDSADGKKTVG